MPARDRKKKGSRISDTRQLLAVTPFRPSMGPDMYSLVNVNHHEIDHHQHERCSSSQQAALTPATTQVQGLLAEHAQAMSTLTTMVERFEKGLMEFTFSPESTPLLEQSIPFLERVNRLREKLLSEFSRTAKLMADLQERPATIRVNRANVAVVVPGEDKAGQLPAANSPKRGGRACLSSP